MDIPPQWLSITQHTSSGRHLLEFVSLSRFSGNTGRAQFLNRMVPAQSPALGTNHNTLTPTALATDKIALQDSNTARNKLISTCTEHLCCKHIVKSDTKLQNLLPYCIPRSKQTLDTLHWLGQNYFYSKLFKIH